MRNDAAVKLNTTIMHAYNIDNIPILGQNKF